MHMCGCHLCGSYIKLLKASCRSLQGIAVRQLTPPLAHNMLRSAVLCRHLSNVAGLWSARSPAAASQNSNSFSGQKVLQHCCGHAHTYTQLLMCVCVCALKKLKCILVSSGGNGPRTARQGSAAGAYLHIFICAIFYPYPAVVRVLSFCGLCG